MSNARRAPGALLAACVFCLLVAAPDRFDWREPDRVVALLRKLQIRPVITIVGSPPWAAVDNRGVHCAPDRATDPQWHQLWKQAALRYPDAPPQPEIGAYYVPPSACPG